MSFDDLQLVLEQEGSFVKLEALYGKLPSGKCPGCSTCCYDGVPASFVEYMSIRRYMAERSILTEALKDRVRAFVLNELTQVNACPFLVDKRCLIYPVRPLTCRLFGFQSRHEQDLRRKTLLKSHRQKQAYYQEAFGFILPKAVVDHVIPFCEAFVPFEKWRIGKSREMYDALMALDAPYFISGQVEDRYFNRSLVDWLLIEMEEVDQVYDRRLEALSNSTKR